MKTPILRLVLALALSTTVGAAGIEIGQDQSSVYEKLGNPIGVIELREQTLRLLYPQGEVTLKNGLVSEIDLMSEAEFTADQQRLKQARADWLIGQEQRAEQHKAEGEAIRADKLQSRAFSVRSAKERVDYWRDFQTRYPEVEVSEQIARALEGYQVELDELRSQQRIAELEIRVARAEQAAAQARLETEKLREETKKLRLETERTHNSDRYGLRYYTDPAITNSRYLYRPPTVTIYTIGQ